jgi:eukaryotic-like serine/threonine-protein kinase
MLPTRTPESLTATPTVKPTPADLSLGDTWTRPADDMVTVYVPGGEFKMGTSDDQLKHSLKLCKETYARILGAERAVCPPATFADERPAHTVVLDGFWIDRLEVTNEQYRRCVEAGACTPPVETGSYTRDTYYGDSAYDDYPVVWVGWGQATEYCAWAGARLPTEAEWEYAARGPESAIFPWGNIFDGTRLNYCDVNCEPGVSDESVDDGYADTAPVGSYLSGASWCGALDMAGNVREWVAGWYGPYHGRQVNPSGPFSGEVRISRGGCWLDTSENARSAKRGQNTPDFTLYKLGFRCARK